jgi:hypothetical protein
MAQADIDGGGGPQMTVTDKRKERAELRDSARRARSLEPRRLRYGRPGQARRKATVCAKTCWNGS